MEVVMSSDANKGSRPALLRGDHDGRENIEVWDEICSPDLTIVAPMFPEPVRGLAAVKAMTMPMHAAFSGLGVTVHELIAEGDTVAEAWTMTGKHTGPLPMPGATPMATDHQVRFTGTSLCTLREGRMAEERVQTDWMGFMQQLGALPTG